MYSQVLHFSGVYQTAHLVQQPGLLHVVPCGPCSRCRGHRESSQDEAISATVMLPRSCRALTA